MKLFSITLLLFLVPIHGHSKLTIESPDNSASFTDQYDENGAKIGSTRQDAFGTTHFYDENGNKKGFKREDGFSQTDYYDENADKKGSVKKSE